VLHSSIEYALETWRIEQVQKPQKNKNKEMQTKRLPFHETVVNAIRNCNPSPSTGHILQLFNLIKETNIPKGYDEIVAAIDDYFNFPGATKWAREIREVKENLLEQKRVSIEKSGDDKKSINLDDLQQEVEKLLALLKDRQQGLMTWNEFMQERLQNLYKLSSRALGK